LTNKLDDPFIVSEIALDTYGGVTIYVEVVRQKSHGLLCSAVLVQILGHVAVYVRFEQ